MRIRRTFLAPVVLAVCAATSVVAGAAPALGAAAPTASVAAMSVTPGSMYYHG